MLLKNSSVLPGMLYSFGSPKSAWLYQFRRGICGDVDKHGSLHIDFSSTGLARLTALKTKSDPPKVIIEYIRTICSESPPQFKAIWVNLSKEYFRYLSHFCLPAPQGCDMNFHRADKFSAVLYRWLTDEPCRIPEYASHQLGVAGVVLSPNQSHLLMVREKPGALFRGWKLPTGLAHQGENISDAAVREVFEETGIATGFGGILAIRQLHDHPGAFGKSDLLAICSLCLSGTDSSVTPEITMCTKELSECSWLPLSALQKATVHSTVPDPNIPEFLDHREELHITTLTSRVVQLLTGQLPRWQLRPQRMQSLRAGQFYDLYLPE